MDAADLADWLHLALIPCLGGEGQRRLLQALGEPAAVFSASFGTLRGIVGETLAATILHHDARAAIEEALVWAALPGNQILTLADATYPQALLTSHDPPLLLYVKGRVELLNHPAFAIVGSRNATKQGEANAEAFAQTLAAAGLTIVSGMAAGIDAAAHRGALQEAAATIAVIGTGCDRIYPARNEALAREIAQKGCIVSEFPLGTPPLPGNFPRRNRIIAGLGRGCLVVEATKQSGSLITARLAAEAGRDVFAIPGSIHSPQSKGCHALIKQGAKLVESAQDILEELRWEQLAAPVRPEEEKAEDDPILAALGGDPCDLDMLVSRTGLSADVLLARLLTLEMSGRVAQLPGGRYQRLN